MGLFYAGYFDASRHGTSTQPHPVLTVAGVVAPVKKWNRFERDWMLVLKDESVTEFHATDFAASRGEYKGWRGDKGRRATFLRRLGAIIKRDVNRLFMVSIEIDAWDVVNKEYLLQEIFHSPFALGGFSVLLQLRKWAKGKVFPSGISRLSSRKETQGGAISRNSVRVLVLRASTVLTHWSAPA